METLIPVIVFIIGIIGTLLITNFLFKKNSVSKSDFNNLLKEKEISDYKIETLENERKKTEEELQTQKYEIKILREDLSNIKSLLASSKTMIENKEKEIQELKIDIADYLNEISEIKEKVTKAESEKVALEQKNINLSEKLQTQKEEIENIGKKFSNEFKVLANSILEEKSRKFTEQNQQNLKILLDPLGENIKEFRKKVEETYDKESKQRFSLEEKIKDLVDLNHKISEEAHNLTKALKGSAKTQGDWGEMILESILENSGLQKGREFFTQEFLRNDAGQTIKGIDGKKMQPDVLIKYPDGRNIIIDSKVSLVAYERYVNAENDIEQEKELKLHLQSLKNHIDGLSAKDYDSYTQTLDFVMLFIPIEPAYLSAIKHDDNLWNYAYKKKILLISPTNLITALKLVKDLWKREDQNRNAFEIAERGGRLYDKFVSFIENLEDIGKNINKANDSYENALKQLKTGKGNIIGQVEKLKELGVKTQKSIPGNFELQDKN
ncbi:MAG: DNA recombination protein RmuC [Bacteroidales bacterium]|nr:DNA recombination protein RmuC [Bacteroidales bacterium]